jgi:hypothetical protein
MYRNSFSSDVGMVERGVTGTGMGLVRMMAILFYLAVVISSVLIIWEGMNMKGELEDGKNIKERVDRSYTYSVILAVSLGLSVLSSLWDWSTSM